MDLQEFIENISGRTGVSIDQLSSAQKARVISWARQNNVEIKETNGHQNAPKNEFIPSLNDTIFNTSGISVGIDVQEIDMLFPSPIIDLKSDSSILEIFHIEEISYAETKENPIKHLTGIFAIKEAIMKCSDLSIYEFKDIFIRHENGRPIYQGFNLSLAYTSKTAHAIAVHKGLYSHSHVDSHDETDCSIGQNTQITEKEKSYKTFFLITASLILGYAISELQLLHNALAYFGY